ncbi:hypothetical protein [Citreimonas salinaria]|uniref:Uncharacterized protein n=1 Tax=Citreimonas salinaria TaxID=321339 RepID=A0A1H3M017_9RHOB|nr:hypothetical protein [Citreimonas salinaria]SDY69923.1 hypothetical protein SAMN05444340_11524 [Citreimonas salinaria]
MHTATHENPVDALMLSVMSTPSPVDQSRIKKAQRAIKAAEDAAEGILATLRENGDFDPSAISEQVYATECRDSVTAHVYLNKHTRLSLALTSDALVPLEDVLPEFLSDAGVWCALTPDAPDHGSYIWLFCEHVACELLGALSRRLH